VNGIVVESVEVEIFVVTLVTSVVFVCDETALEVRVLRVVVV